MAIDGKESSMPPLIRKATAEDAARIRAIARAAYAKYVPRIGHEPAPMVADFAAEVAAGHVVVIATAGAGGGYMIPRPQTHAHLIANIAVDPGAAGPRPGAAAHGSRRRRGQAPSPARDTALHQRGDDGESVHVRAHGLRRNPSRGREGSQPRLSALDSSRRRSMTGQQHGNASRRAETRPHHRVASQLDERCPGIKKPSLTTSRYELRPP